MATEHNSCKNMGDNQFEYEFDMLKVEVPIIFLGTVGFSPRREGRYTSFVIPKDFHPQ